MADTTFVDGTTIINAAWLNDTNDHIYHDTPISPATTVHDSSVIKNTPAGNIASTTVQAAINELDTEKVALANLAAPTGSSLVGYQPAGTGAVARTVTSKLGESVSVLDFGADPTGVLDSTASFANAAASNINGAHIRVPAGIWNLVSSPSANMTTSWLIDSDALFKGVGVLTGSVASIGSGYKVSTNSTIGAAQNTYGIYSNLAGTRSGGAIGTQISYNYLGVTDDQMDATTAGGSKSNALFVQQGFGSASTKGGRQAIWGLTSQNAITSAANTDRNYVGVAGQILSSTGDGGTVGTPLGAYFGINGYAGLNSGATNVYNLTAGEFNSVANTGSSVSYRSGIQIAGGGLVQGSVTDAALSVSNLGGSTTWKTGLLFGSQNGGAALGASSTAIEITDGGGILNGIAITSPISGNILSYTTPSSAIVITPTNSSYNSPNYSIEFGAVGVANTPFIDFHSSGNNIDYDARIIASGGTGVSGSGALNFIGAAFSFSGNIMASTAGIGIYIKEGSNAKQGVANLVAGTVTVANTSVTANSRIFLTSQSDGGTVGFIRVSSRVVGTSFTITSSSATDTSTIAYEIFEPA